LTATSRGVNDSKRLRSSSRSAFCARATRSWSSACWMVSRSCRRPTWGAVRRTMSHLFRTVGHRRRPIL